jgi:bleomycin hydrolase
MREEALKFEKIYPEVKVDQKNRQQGYVNFTTTDDHLMLLTGISRDQEGNKYYITKNSWGTERNSFGGYLNMSESFVRAKSISVMVHKNSIPKDILKKLKF